MFYHGKLEFFDPYQPKIKLKLLTDKMHNDLNRHINQIDLDDDKYSIVTPIYAYIARNYTTEKTYDDFVGSDKFKMYFGRKEFSLDSPEEIQ